MLQGELRWGKTQSPAAATEGWVPGRPCLSQQVSGAVARSMGSHLLGATVMAPSCSPFAGCSKAHPSSVSQSKMVLLNTPQQ